MRKFVIALMIGVLLIAGTVQAASVSANAVKTLVSRTLTKVCAANDNRCVRLVSGASGVLATTATGALALFGKTNWIGLILTMLLPAAGTYVFNLFNGKKVTVEKNDWGATVTQIEESKPKSDAPVISYEKAYSGTLVSKGPVHPKNTVDADVTHTKNYVYRPEITGGDGIAYFKDLKTAIRRLPGVTAPVKTAGDFAGGSSNTFGTPTFYTYSYDEDGDIVLETVRVRGLSEWHFRDAVWVAWYGGGKTTYSVWSFQYYLVPVSVTGRSGTVDAYVKFVPVPNYDGEIGCDYAYYYGSDFCFADEALQEDAADSDDVNSYYRTSGNAETVTDYPYTPLKDWIDALPDDDKAELIGPELTAAFIDELWKQTAAQDGYEGEPYVSGKITPELVSSVASDFPTVGDALETISADGTQLTQDRNTGKLHDSTTDPTTPGQGSNPSTTPDTPTDTKPGTIGGTNTGTAGDQNINVDVKLDLGDYPDIKQPTLEEPPTAASILDPIFNLFPNLKDYRVPERDLSCPPISIEAFGETYSTDLHCTLIEDNRTTISASMLLFFTIMSLIIVLGA